MTPAAEWYSGRHVNTRSCGLQTRNKYRDVINDAFAPMQSARLCSRDFEEDCARRQRANEQGASMKARCALTREVHRSTEEARVRHDGGFGQASRARSVYVAGKHTNTESNTPQLVERRGGSLGRARGGTKERTEADRRRSSCAPCTVPNQKQRADVREEASIDRKRSKRARQSQRAQRWSAASSAAHPAIQQSRSCRLHRETH
jgi:hypothetical protein